MAIKEYAVIGAGTMGNGIAHLAGMNGRKVTLLDIEQEFLDNAMATIRKNLDRQIKKELLTQDEADGTLARITTSLDLADVATADLVIEAVLERFEIKSNVWKKLDEIAGADAILASNTSSMSITLLASLTGRPEKFIGMHFFNPVPMMSLVEGGSQYCDWGKEA